MPGIRKRSDNRYEVRTQKNGIRKSFYTKTKIDAKKLMKSINRLNITYQTKGLEIKDWLVEWIETYKKNFVKPNTYKDIKNYINKIINDLGKYKLNQLTTPLLQKYLNGLEKSRKKEMLVLYFRSAYKKAVQLKYTTNNPFDAIIFDKKIKTKRYAYNFDEQCKIINAIKGTDLEQPILFYLLTGARKNEIIKSTSDIDLENNLIKIHGTKTEKSILRIVDASKEYTSYLYNFLRNNKMMSTEYISKNFRKLCNKLNISNSGIHRLRHTFATNQYLLGARDKQIQYWLGHESIETTMNIYTDIDKTATKNKIVELYNNYYYIEKKV